MRRSRPAPVRRTARNAKVTTATEAYSIAASSRGRLRGELGEQPRSRRRRRRQHHPSAVGRGASAASLEPTTRTAASSAPALSVRTSSPSASASTSRAIPPATPGEHRDVGPREAVGLGEDRAALGQRDQLRGGGPGRDLPRPAGVHPAEQRLDQPVGHLVAEPRGHQVADRHVALDRQHPLRRGPGPAPRAVSTPLSASWSRSSGAPIRLRGSGRSAPRVQTREEASVGCTISRAQRAGQLDALGSTVQHRLRADVDDHPADRAAPQLPADLVGALEDHDLVPGVGQVPCRGQPGDPGSHDGDPHPPSLSGHGWVTAGNARRRPAVVPT